MTALLLRKALRADMSEGRQWWNELDYGPTRFRELKSE